MALNNYRIAKYDGFRQRRSQFRPSGPHFGNFWSYLRRLPTTWSRFLVVNRYLMAIWVVPRAKKNVFGQGGLI